jgi:hypothetical protein
MVPMPIAHLMAIRSPEFQAMHERVLQVTELTSRLNILPFEDEAGRTALRVFINQGCTFLDYAGIRLGDRVTTRTWSWFTVGTRLRSIV